MRKLRATALSLILALVFGTTLSFAAVWSGEPTDPNNPTGVYKYTCEDGVNFDRLSFRVNGLSSVDFVFEGRAYESNKTYKQIERFTEGYAVANGKVYKLNSIGGWTPGTQSAAKGEDIVLDYTGSTFGFEVELIPTDEIPENSIISTYPNKTAKDVITYKYLVDGKEVSKADYDKAKTGSYTEYMKKRFTGYGKETVDREVITFDKLIKLAPTGANAENAPYSATFSFRKDQYITAEMNYTTTYEIVREDTGDSNSGSSGSGTNTGNTGANTGNSGNASGSDNISSAAGNSGNQGSGSSAGGNTNSDSGSSNAGSNAGANSGNATPSSGNTGTNTGSSVAANSGSAASTTSKTSGTTKNAKAAPKKVTTITVNIKTVNAAALNKALKKTGVKASSIKTITLGSKVKKVSPGAFKNFKNAKTLTIKTKSLKKASVKNALKGSKVSNINVKVGSKALNKKYVKAYKKIFTKKNAGKGVKIS